MEPAPLRPPTPRRRLARPVLVVLVLAVGAAAAWWWLRPGEPPAPTAELAPPPALVASAPALPPSAPAEPDPPAPEQPLAEQELVPALEALVGRDAVTKLLQSSGLPQRIVATVDNLARSSAPASMWPVQPTTGRFTVVQADGGERIAAANARRYEALVALAERLDPRLLADWYRRALPLLQPAYEELGYPGQRFHARLVQVLDHLLATPAAPAAPAVRLTEVRGPEPSTRPWVRYEYADPALEQASAGRKILWRVGLENQQRLMKVLAAFREEIRTAPR